jgi:hypothetical protein
MTLTADAVTRRAVKGVGGSGVVLDVAIDTRLGAVLDSPPLVTACIQMACRHHGVGGPT